MLLLTMKMTRDVCKTEGCGNSANINCVLVLGLLASASMIYVINVKFYVSISDIAFEMKDLTTMLEKINLGFLKRASLRKHLTNFTDYNAAVPPCPWPPKYLRGREPLNRTAYDLETLNKIHTFMKNGHYRPTNCTPYQSVAIVVPYRDREPQLRIFLNNVLPRIYRQQLEFRVYIVEQTPGSPFNRGMLANIGYQEAMKDFPFDCIVVHDLDILPEDDRNFYACTENPIHVATKVEKFRYNLPYESFAGGITTFSRESYKKINGFSNQYFGWGGEDDDLYKRIQYNKLKLTRPHSMFGHCGSVKHAQANTHNNRMEILKTAYKRWQKDGLNSLNYTLHKKQENQLYVWIFAHIDMSAIRKELKFQNS